jgi:hypothetical protein
VARVIGQALAAQQLRVLLIDDDWFDVRAARMLGLEAWYGDPLSEHAERVLDLAGIGSMLAMSTRREINSLACVRFRADFGSHGVFRLRVLGRAQEEGGRHEHASTLRAPILFGENITHALLDDRIEQGWRIKTTRLSETFGFAEFLAEHGAEALPLFGIDEPGRPRIANLAHPLQPRAGMLLTALVPPRQVDAGTNRGQAASPT